MVFQYDMHTHSTESDGELTPEQLVVYAKEKGIKGMAVTDHNVSSRQDEIKAMAESEGLEYVTGVEVKTTIEPLLKKHGFTGVNMAEILVYGLRNSPELAAMSEQHLAQRAEYIQALRDELKNHDYAEIPGSERKGPIVVTLDMIKEKTDATVFGGRVFLEILMEKAGVSDPVARSFFVDQIRSKVYAGNGKDPFLNLDIRDGIAKAREWGRFVSLAHLFANKSKVPMEFYEAAMPDLVEAGLQGLEMSYPIHTEEQMDFIQALAKKYDLVTTGGSDFHSPRKHTIGGCGVDEKTFRKIQEICLS
jgi:predicted metal-dependent phosphoesterase TrpH